MGLIIKLPDCLVKIVSNSVKRKDGCNVPRQKKIKPNPALKFRHRSKQITEMKTRVTKYNPKDTETSGTAAIKSKKFDQQKRKK
jgi:hypothetical protein